MNTPNSNNTSSELEKLLNDFPSEITEPEKSMAKELMNQAQSNHPDAKFVNELSRKLKNNHPSVSRIRQKERFIWLAASGFAAVLLFFLVGLPLLQPTTPLLAAITPTQIQEGTIAIQPSVQPTSLPLLPFLGPSTVQAGANLSEQFPNASWTLQAELPTGPDSAEVYKIQNPPEEISPDSVRKLANQFGLAGNIYQRTSSQSEFHSYLVIDGSAQLSVFGFDQSFSFLPDVFSQSNEHTQPLSFEQISDKATTFLKEKGLLTFAYRVEPGLLRQNQVMINRLLDENVPLLSTEPTSPEFLVEVASDGSILEVRGNVLGLESKGKYPLRSASEAWQALLNGKIGGRFGYQVSQLFPPAADLSWTKQYQTGQQVDIIGNPQTMKPADGSQPIVMVNNLVLEGNLPEISEDNQVLMHITGTMLTDTRLQVQTIEPSSVPPENLGFTGLLKTDGTNFTLQTMDSRTLILVDPPATGLPVDEPASISGKLLPDGRIEWQSIIAGPSICSSFSSGFVYTDVSAGGGGGGWRRRRWRWWRR